MLSVTLRTNDVPRLVFNRSITHSNRPSFRWESVAWSDLARLLKRLIGSGGCESKNNTFHRRNCLALCLLEIHCPPSVTETAQREFSLEREQLVSPAGAAEPG